MPLAYVAMGDLGAVLCLSTKVGVHRGSNCPSASLHRKEGREGRGKGRTELGKEHKKGHLFSLCTQDVLNTEKNILKNLPSEIIIYLFRLFSTSISS